MSGASHFQKELSEKMDFWVGYCRNKYLDYKLTTDLQGGLIYLLTTLTHYQADWNYYKKANWFDLQNGCKQTDCKLTSDYKLINTTNHKWLQTVSDHTNWSTTNDNTTRLTDHKLINKWYNTTKIDWPQTSVATNSQKKHNTTKWLQTHKKNITLQNWLTTTNWW